MEEAASRSQNLGSERTRWGWPRASTILRSDFETDRWTGYLHPSASGREAGFPSSLGSLHPEHRDL